MLFRLFFWIYSEKWNFLTRSGEHLKYGFFSWRIRRRSIAVITCSAGVFTIRRRLRMTSWCLLCPLVGRVMG